MAKNNINSNFENLKAEMMKKKEVAKDINSNKDVIQTESENVYVDENKIVNKTVTHNTNKEINNDEITYNSLSVSNDNSKGTNISQNKIVIKKAQKVQPPKRITYYLNQDTIKKIEKYSKLTGMGKSEFVQTLLDVSLNNLEIE